VKQKGMSLFELLIVVVVLGILAFVSSFVIGDKIARGRDARRKSDLDRLKIAMYDYIFDNDCFPSSLPDCGQPFEGGGNVYLPSMPCDELGNPYVYVAQNSDCPIWFRIFTKLEVESDRSIETSGCSAGCGPECVYNYGVSSTNTKANIGCVKYYVCPPGGGKENSCQAFEDPYISECPKIWENDPTCGGIVCDSVPQKDRDAYKCKNASGKTIPKDTDFY